MSTIVGALVGYAVGLAIAVPVQLAFYRWQDRRDGFR